MGGLILLIMIYSGLKYQSKIPGTINIHLKKKQKGKAGPVQGCVAMGGGRV
jgi:hypothetical protein